MKRLLRDIDTLITRLMSYSQSERRAVSLIAVLFLGVLIYKINTPKPQLDSTELSAIDSINRVQRKEYFEKLATQRHPKEPYSRYIPPNRPNYPAKQKIYIELNTADSASLIRAVGVGEVIAKSILVYRKMLGGFVNIEQLREVYAINDQNFATISQQFYVDSAVIQKIDINFAPAYELSRHPYITKNMAERVAKGRKLKGGWKNIRELIDNDILLPDEAHKVAPYLVFH